MCLYRHGNLGKWVPDLPFSLYQHLQSPIQYLPNIYTYPQIHIYYIFYIYLYIFNINLK